MASILIIEDDPAIRDDLREYLRSIGHAVLEAPNGAAGLMQLGRHCVDVALVDMVMPHKDGVETIKEIRAVCPEVKIIAMSGRPYKDLYLSIAAKLGADEVLSKPFQPSDLSLKIMSLTAPRYELPAATD